jgi:glycosyltransferase involved in cell wall biosynthesis
MIASGAVATRPPSPSEAPLVTVIVPSFNHDRYVRETIASVWAQTYDRVELIVVDDASHDASREIIEQARRERDFLFLRNEANLGLNPSLERAIACAAGEYVSVLASDDLLEPTKLAEQVEFLRRGEWDGVFSDGWLLHPDGRRTPLGHDRLASKFASGSALRHLYTCDTEGPLLQSGLFRTSMWRELAPIRRSFGSDDWALSICMLRSYRIGFLDRRLFVYRQHTTNTFRQFWRTLPMRVEVLSLLSPPEHRAEGLANVLTSHGAYLEAAGDRRMGRRFRMAALALDWRVGRVVEFVRALCRPLMRLRSTPRAGGAS